MCKLVGVWLGWSMRKYVGSLLLIKLGSSIGYVKGRIFGLAIGETHGVPLVISVGWDDFIAWKYRGIIIGASKEFVEGGIFGLALGNAVGASQRTSLLIVLKIEAP